MSNTDKKVGASVIPSAPPIAGPIIGPPPIYPRVLYDDRRHHHYHHRDDYDDDEDDYDIVLVANIAAQTVRSNITSTLILTTALASIGGSRISGNSIHLPRRGDYRIHMNITLSRPTILNGSNTSNFSIMINGGVGDGTIISNSIVDGVTSVYNGNSTIGTSSRGENISFLVNNMGGPLQVLGGTITIQYV